MKRSYLIISPAFILLPCQPACAQIFLFCKRSCGKSHSPYNGFKRRTRRPGLSYPVVHRFIGVIIQSIPGFLGHSKDKIHAVIGGCGNKGQHLPGLWIHNHRTALILLISLIELLLPADINIQLNILPIFCRLYSQCLFFFTLLVQNGNPITLFLSQPIFIKFLKTAFSNDALLIVALAFHFLQFFCINLLHISQ